MSWVKFGAILIGGALGTFLAILSIKVFDSDASQLGFVAACSIFGAIVCAAISAGFPQRAQKSGRSDLSTPLEARGMPKSQRAHPPDSPPLSPI